MKSLVRRLVFTSTCAAALIFSSHAARAQITQISNLAELSADGRVVGSDFWVAQSFITGPTAFSLVSVQLRLTSFGFPGGDFVVSIYDDVFNQPGTKLATFSGPNPSGATNYTYFVTNNVILAAATKYWIVTTATAPTTFNSHYGWLVASTTNYTATSGWTTGDTSESGDGVTWSSYTWFPLKLAVNAVDSRPILSTGLTNGIFSINFFTVPDQSYTVQYCTNLTGTNWNSLTNFTAAAYIIRVDVPVTNSPLFFRTQTP